MKTVLFFYLNSLGLILVQTQTPTPYFTPYTTDVGCKQTQAGHEYAGPLNVTRSGRICQRWDSDKPHHSYFKDSTLFPEGSSSAAGNKCRNPQTNEKDVWCYTTDPNTRWEYCNVKFCDSTTPISPTKPKESTTSSPTSPTRTHPPPDSTNSAHCKLTKAGHEYAGPVSVTRSGRTCQRWDSNYPHRSYFKNSTSFPEGSASAAGNKCRNPQSDEKDVWCYTTDPNTRWEYCNVPFCGVGCKLTKAGQEYAGPRSVTKSGRTCQRWDSDKPHYSYFKNSTLFPEGSVEAAGNKCRNPDNTKEGVWCYTTDPNKRWELCDVPFCCTGNP